VKDAKSGIIIVLNGPSCSGKTSIQKEFQRIMMPELWVKIGINNLFEQVMPDIIIDTISFWQSSNSIRWIEKSEDAHGNPLVTLHVGVEGEKVAYAMNSAIAGYAANGCNVIVDYVAYDKAWLADLEKKCASFKTYYVAVEIALDILEQREKMRGTFPVGYARSHYVGVYGDKKYDLVVKSGEDTVSEIAAQIRSYITK